MPAGQLIPPASLPFECAGELNDLRYFQEAEELSSLKDVGFLNKTVLKNSAYKLGK